MGARIKHRNCPVCKLDLVSSTSQKRSAHVASCIASQVLVKDVVRSMAASTRSVDYVQDPENAEHFWDYERIKSLEYVPLKFRRGSKNRSGLVANTVWKSTQNDIEDFQKEDGTYDPYITLILLLCKGLRTKYCLPSDNAEIYIQAHHRYAISLNRTQNRAAIKYQADLREALNAFNKFFKLGFSMQRDTKSGMNTKA